MASFFYADLRTQALQFDPNRVSVPITVRTLESIIRLATAHAKLRLAKSVEMVDIEMAGSLVRESIFQDTDESRKKKKKKEDVKEEDESVYQDPKQVQADKKKQQLANALRKRDADGDVHMEEDHAQKNLQLSREERLARRHNNIESPKKENQQPNSVKTRQ